MKFLIIRFSSIGDIVLTTPVIRCLKKQIATAEVHYLTKSAFRPILEANPFVDKIHVLQDDLSPLLSVLQHEDFDYVIDLHHNLRTMRVKRALGKKAYSFDKLNVRKWLYTAFKWNRLPDKHIVDRYLGTLAAFGVKNDGAGLDYFIPVSDNVREKDIPTAHLAGYVGLVIGAALATKKLPLHKLKELCTTLDHPVILLGGAEDAAVGDELAAIDPVKIYNSCGKFSLNESADLVRRAKLIVTHDTGLMHIAAAFKKPIISVWGNTVPEFGMYPYFGAAADTPAGAAASPAAGGPAGLPMGKMMEIDGLSCRPCSKIGYKKCPRGHFKCMELQSMEMIAETIRSTLWRS
jgi:ADP-heptose:LPS heptosyltransferase